MPMNDTPAAMLHRLVQRRASGELICASEDLEVHVYLQAGRVAWATASSHPFAFTRHLRQHAEISAETFQSVLEECRRARLPLGETLVAWQLATHEQVRSALRHQIEGALQIVFELTSAQVVFLERTQQYAQYRAELTFLLADVAPQSVAAAPEEAEANVAAARLVHQLRDANEFAWVELLDGARVVAQSPKSDDGARVPEVLLRNTLLANGTFAALRGHRGALLGVRLSAPRRTLWCRVDDEADFGAAVSTLGVLAVDAPRSRRMTASDAGEAVVGDAPELTGCREFMARAADVLGIALCSPAGAPALAVLRGGLTASGMSESIAAIEPALACDVGGVPSDTVPELVHRAKSLVAGLEHAWVFGTQIECPRSGTLWMVVDRTSPQGLGWAYLTSLTRQLARSGAPR
jgi:hypothetical protein